MNKEIRIRFGSHRVCLVGMFDVLLGFGQPVVLAQNPRPANPVTQPLAPALRAYADFTMRNDGDSSRGWALFAKDQRAACAKCHSVDGTSGMAGPDLFAVGDKFPRHELIRALLEPSAAIAVGYGTTIVETKSGEEFQGVIKESTDAWLELKGADGLPVRIAKSDIAEAARIVRPGRNVMAIHCRQNTGGQYIDAGLIQFVRPNPLSSAKASP